MTSISQLTPTQVAAETSARVLDVREPDEVATGAIAGSVNIPLGELAARQDELDPATPVITVCQGGGRSQKAAEALSAAGYRVSNLDGGMNAWIQDGKPVA
ncbi:rhodanese-like domain-containing protein [Modestobacter muralis]|uniref:Rhodanese-like domain-containing protein n=1 Tax=Modestobacter muralis TaxID=1608614 RepID=A0A6P0EX52_9ACTN|nr:rhodanese-like domain-containing protein [Modestobacter muralis]NEK95146.1 rhodanese-like domain-containing protein [Modestobacter muralis]NEN52034.1 rhodanese-like domain-containing protein [Modestobacter muralis]